MISLAYFSSATAPLDQAALDDLLRRAQAANARLGITGLLCHYDGSFLQFLEGPEHLVEPLYDRIAVDPRHRSVLRVHRAAISERAFPDWSMALVRPGAADAVQQAFVRNLRHIEIAPGAEHGAALKGLLDAFRAWLR